MAAPTLQETVQPPRKAWSQPASTPARVAELTALAILCTSLGLLAGVIAARQNTQEAQLQTITTQQSHYRTKTVTATSPPTTISIIQPPRTIVRHSISTQTTTLPAVTVTTTTTVSTSSSSTTVP